MNQTAILWPVIAQVLLVYFIYGLLGVRRASAIRRGSVRISEFRENRNEPPESLFVHNNLLNQFQLPVLFYVACVCLYTTNGSSLVTVALAWLFVVSRYVHAAIQVTSNRIRFRQPAFLSGYIASGGLWLWLSLHLLGLV